MAIKKELQQKCITVTISGKTNAGKSTLINNLVQQKVSIVTPNVQTTRVRLRAITMYNNTQLIFTDTPGIFTPKTKLEKFLTGQAWSALRDTDLVLLLVDAKDYLCDEIVLKIQKLKSNAILVINKIDLVTDAVIEKIEKHFSQMYKFKKIFKISALHDKGIDELLSYLSKIAPVHPWLYPEDQLTDAPIAFLTAETTREKLFLNLRQELPYSLTVITEQIDRGQNNSLIIKQAIYVPKENHKKIILGERGERIKNISIQSKLELEQLLETKVHLFLFVKVHDTWLDNPQEYIGYA